MEIGELKELLESYKFDSQYIKAKTKEIESFNCIAKSTSRLDSIKEIEEKTLSKLLDKKVFIEDLIQKLKQPYKTLFYMKYISFLTFDQIADRLNYSTKRIYQLHKEGMDDLLLKVSDIEQNISIN